MSQLQDLQRRMAQAIMHPLTSDETMRIRRKDGTSNQTEADQFIKPNDRLTSFERLEIYNRQYWFRLYSSFEEDFPGLKAILGRKKFEGVMRNYLTDCPSTSFTLRNLGSQLEPWLLEHLEWIEPNKDLCLSMVRIEWAHIEAFDAAQGVILSPEELENTNEDTRFCLQPSLRLLLLSHPVDDLLISVRNEAGSQDAASNSATGVRKCKAIRKIAGLPPEQIYLAVHRQENSVYYKRLQLEEFRLLESLVAGNTLGQAIELAMKDTGLSEQESGHMLQESFATWVTLGWLIKPDKRNSL
jgi:hypothetical protein